VRYGRLIQRLSIVAAAVLLICALQALAGAVGDADGAAPAPAPGAGDTPDASLAPARSPADGVVSRAERRRVRRMKRAGGTDNADGGAPVDASPWRIASRDGGRDTGWRGAVVTPPVAPPPPAPPPPPPTPTGPSTSMPISELGFNTCQKLPAGKRAVKVNLKPEVELPELVAWISSITCKSFVVPGHLSAGGKKITIVTQGMMTPKEAYVTFLSALDSIGLTVEHGPGYLKIIETAKAKSSSLPVYGFDGRPTEQKARRQKPAGAGD